ncbi:type II toxin-antitoxin system RelE/ParE family toxin [Flavobacterium sp.]|uniref:type II toxin-antitoxin system RelE/ParE family toxin n=1 Tax=Flavobacterium sp. TaxID=239 RepID=UPI003B9BD20B
MVKAGSLKVVWDLEALNQFKEVLSYLEQQSKQAPKIVKKAILERINQIKRNPLTCESDRLKWPVDTNFRAFIVFSYRVTYQIKQENKEIRILRIRHTSREPLGY